MRCGKKLLLFLVVIIAMWRYPVDSTDVGDLRPIQVLVAYTDQENVVLDGGDGMVGRGATWDLAMADLESSASGVPFFGTTATVVLEDGGLVTDLLMEERLRPGVSVYFGEGKPEDLATCFKGKSGEITIQTLKTGALVGGYMRIPTVVKTEGGYQIGR